VPLQVFPFDNSYPGLVHNTTGNITGLAHRVHIWTRDSDTNNTIYNLHAREDIIEPQIIDSQSPRYGFSVRCVVNRTDTTQRDKFISTPYNFPYSGYYNYGGGVRRQGSDGGWWSRSSYTTAGQAYRFRLDTNGLVYPQYGVSVGGGFAVRCVGE